MKYLKNKSMKDVEGFWKNAGGVYQDKFLSEIASEIKSDVIDLTFHGSHVAALNLLHHFRQVGSVGTDNGLLETTDSFLMSFVMDGVFRIPHYYLREGKVRRIVSLTNNFPKQAYNAHLRVVKKMEQDGNYKPTTQERIKDSGGALAGGFTVMAIIVGMIYQTIFGA